MNIARYTVRINQILLNKLEYISKYEYRSKNKEIEQLIKKRIIQFEKENGKIDLSKLDDL